MELEAGATTEGMLVDATPDSIRVATEEGDRLAFARHGVRAMQRYVRPGGGPSPTALGMLAGTAIGLIAGLAAGNAVSVEADDSINGISRSKPMFVAVFAPAGLLLGGLVGTTAEHTAWQPVSAVRSTLAGVSPAARAAADTTGAKAPAR